jgi:RNA polymerases N / 8 kDa subunit
MLTFCLVCSDALDALGLSRYCCRRMLMTHVGEQTSLHFTCFLMVLYVTVLHIVVIRAWAAGCSIVIGVHQVQSSACHDVMPPRA